MKYFIVTVSILFSYIPSFATVNFDIHFSPISNMIYQLDCISGALRSCSKETFEKLWDESFLKTEDDKKLLNDWKTLAEGFGVELISLESKKISLPLREKLRIAHSQALNKEDYFQRLDLLLSPQNKKYVSDVINHFYPSFLKWWKEVAQKKGLHFNEEIKKILNRDPARKHLSSFAKFYQFENETNENVVINLYYRPSSKENTRGEQIKNYSSVEFLEDEKPQKRIDVVIHEICHYLYGRTHPKNTEALKQQFLSLSLPYKNQAFFLLNESLAAAFGNGIINRAYMPKKTWDKFLKTEKSFYDDYYIDTAAKALLPFLEKRIKNEETLYHNNFAQSYVELLNKVFGKKLSAPRPSFKEMVLVMNSDFSKSLGASVIESLRTSSMLTSRGTWSQREFIEDIKSKSDTPYLYIMRASDISGLVKYKVIGEKESSTLKLGLQKSPSLAYGFETNPGVLSYLILAENDDEALKWIKKLSLLEEGFTGIAEVSNM